MSNKFAFILILSILSGCDAGKAAIAATGLMPNARAAGIRARVVAAWE